LIIKITGNELRVIKITLLNECFVGKILWQNIEKNIGKNKGSFKFTREESRKTGGE